jgi:hypothetical protein
MAGLFMVAVLALATLPGCVSTVESLGAAGEAGVGVVGKGLDEGAMVIGLKARPGKLDLEGSGGHMTDEDVFDPYEVDEDAQPWIDSAIALVRKSRELKPKDRLSFDDKMRILTYINPNADEEIEEDEAKRGYLLLTKQVGRAFGPFDFSEKASP